jgi:prepilin-type N-terminal cleavage/methylation domain-containing protein
MSNRGVSLVELLVALTLFGVVAGGVCRVLFVTLRSFTEQIQYGELNHTVRSAAVILSEELRELDTGDPQGGDIVTMSPSSLTYKSARGLYSLCGPPGAGENSVTLSRWLNSDAPSPATDSLLVFAEGDARTSTVGRWLHLDVVDVSSRGLCPGGSSGTRARVRGPDVELLRYVREGAPARAFEVRELKRYIDARGSWWLGMRRLRKAEGRWPPLQPMLGPLAPRGFEFRYFDRLGRATRVPDSVSSIRVVVVAAPTNKVGSTPARAARMTRRLEFRIVLRNNPRP